MKKTLALLPLLLLAALAFAQPAPMAIIGKADASTPYLVLSWAEQYGIITVADTIQVKPDHTFAHLAKPKEPTTGFLSVGDKAYRVWLKPGSSLTMDLADGQPVFSGDAGAYSTYFTEDQKLFSKFFEDYARQHPGYQNSPESHIAFLDAMTLHRLNFLENYSSKLSADGREKFTDQVRLSLIYQNLIGKLDAAGADLAHFKFYQDKYKTGNQPYYTYSDKVALDDTLLLPNPWYGRFITQLVAGIARQRQMAGGQKFAIEPYLHHAMLVVDELAADAPTATKLKAMVLNNVVEDIRWRKKVEWLGPVNATLADLNSKYKDPNLLLVKEKFDKIAATDVAFLKGNPAPAFTLTDANGKRYTLEGFEGKKVYLDLGAGWCGWCIKGVPAWNRLVEQHAANKGVVFISVGMDEKEAEWRAWTKKHKPKGLLLFAGEGGLKNKFATDYQVLSLPRFILLDEEGKIEAFSAPGPEQLAKELLSTTEGR